MKYTLSIRSRVTLWFAAALMVCLCVTGLTVWTALRHKMLNSVDRELQERLAGLERILNAESPGGEPRLIIVELEEYATGLSSEQSVRCFDSSHREIYSFPSSPHLARSATAVMNIGGNRYLVEVGTSLQVSDEVLRSLAAIMLLAVPFILVPACAGGWWLSRRALAPVDAMTQEANQLGIRKLSARLPEPGTGDELDRFARAWNGLLGRLQGAVERLSRFTADASHELRSPVALIRATAELALRQQRSPDEYRRALSQIEAESRRMTALIEDLLTLARSDEGTASLEAVSLESAIEGACSEKRDIARNKALSLAIDNEDARVAVQANSLMLKHLIGLLLDNAVKFTPAGGSVVVRARRVSESAVAVEVSDTGVGIAPEHIPHLFERFWRVDSARSPGGFGLGLALARAFAEAHGTRLEVESVPGHGSTFRFTLAMAPYSR